MHGGYLIKDRSLACGAFLICLLIILPFYSGIFSHPNAHMFTVEGDGVKNYHNFAYHIAHDSSYWSSEAMGYPYGDRLFFYDAQPILSNGLKALNELFPWVEGHSVGILNLLLLFSVPVAAFFLYLIFRHYRMDKGYAMISAVAVALLSPQIMRFLFHYGLAYCCVVPMSWYMLLKARERKPPSKWDLLLGTNTLFWFLIHPYLGAIIALFTGAFLLGDALIPPFLGWRKFIRAFVAFLFQGMLPLLIYVALLAWLDPFGGRPDKPHGIYEYTASLKGVFLPYHSFVDGWRDLIGFYPGTREKLAYLGVPAMIFLAVFLVRSFRNWGRFFFKGSASPFKTLKEHKERWILLLVGFLFFLLSLGIPIHQFPVILDLFPPLWNFRSLGRFAWVFYFMANGVAFFFFWKWMKDLRARGGRWKQLSLVFYALPLLLIMEAIPYHSALSERMTTHPNLFRKELLPDEYGSMLQKVDETRYQAILPFPFYMIGAEYLVSQAEGQVQIPSQVLSYHKGLPLIGGGYKAPVDHAGKMIMLSGPSFYDKKIQGDFPGRRPLLLMKTEGTDRYEEYWTGKADTLFKEASVLFSEMPLERFFKDRRSELLARYRKAREEGKDGLVFRDKMEDRSTPISYRGKGAFRGGKSRYNLLWEKHPHRLDTAQEYIASFWYYHKKSRLGHAMACIDEKDTASGEGWWEPCTDPRFSHVIDGEWSMVELRFSPRRPDTRLRLFVKGANRYKGDSITVDELLIRRAGQPVFEVLDTTASGKPQELYWNGHFVDLPVSR